MKKVLIVTYYWPPAGGPGVQRILKFTKYLPAYGWQPVILTVRNGVYTAQDPSLKKDVDPAIQIYYSSNPEPDKLYRSFVNNPGTTPVSVLGSKQNNWKKNLAHKIRMNFFIPDAKKYWRFFGFRTGKKIIRQEQPQLIFSSSPPPTTHLIAMDLSQWSGLPWVADFRDPWSKIHYYSGGRSKKAQKKDQQLEKTVTDACSHVVCVSNHFAGLLDINDSSKLNIIHNGYDETDFEKSDHKTSRFTITYVGGLTANRYYPDFFVSLKSMLENKQIDSKKIQIALAGSINPEIKTQLQDLFMESGIVKFYGYLAHKKAIQLMQNSDLLLLFNENVADYHGHLPGKLFEYMASGTPVLAIAERNGEAAEIINRCQAGEVISPADDPAELLLKYFDNWQNGTKKEVNRKEIENFSRQALTANLANLFDKTINTI